MPACDLCTDVRDTLQVVGPRYTFLQAKGMELIGQYAVQIFWSDNHSSGIYNFRVHHEQILVPVVLRHWNVEALEGLTPEADQARDKLVAYIERIGRIAQRSERVGAVPR